MLPFILLFLKTAGILSLISQKRFETNDLWQFILIRFLPFNLPLYFRGIKKKREIEEVTEIVKTVYLLVTHNINQKL